MEIYKHICAAACTGHRICRLGHSSRVSGEIHGEDFAASHIYEGNFGWVACASPLRDGKWIEHSAMMRHSSRNFHSHPDEKLCPENSFLPREGRLDEAGHQFVMRSRRRCDEKVWILLLMKNLRQTRLLVLGWEDYNGTISWFTVVSGRVSGFVDFHSLLKQANHFSSVSLLSCGAIYSCGSEKRLNDELITR